jgi:dsDNA-binding SOS-regulon protein
MPFHLGEIISKRILMNYSMTPNEFNKIMINHLMKSSLNHYVSLFKDYLIYDEMEEFLNRFYKKEEIKPRLLLITDYYSHSSRLFPNYSKLNEGKYIYKNIEKKQRVIDIIEGNGIKKFKKNENIIIFNSDIYNSILDENRNDKSKMKDLFGSNIFTNKNNNDSFNSIINFTKSLTELVENKTIQKEKKKSSLKNISYSQNKTDMTSTMTNTRETNRKDNKIYMKIKVNFNVKKLIKQNINLINKLNNFKLSDKILQNKEKPYKLNEINNPKSTRIISKTKSKNEKNMTKLNQSDGKNIFKNLKKKIIFPVKHSYLQSMPNRISTYSKLKKKFKKFELKDIKDIINKSSKQKYNFSKEILKITIPNKLNKTNIPECIKIKSFFPYKNLKTYRNSEINKKRKNDYNSNYYSEKQNRKCKSKIT